MSSSSDEDTAFGFGVFLGAIIAAFLAWLFTHTAITSDRPELPSDFKSVCVVQGGVPVNDVHFKPLCIKGGQTIPVPVVK
jgi:hypothetical protein